MKKLFYLAFCLTVAMSLGCVNITYPCITDNSGNGNVNTNTNGKAHLDETSQTGLLANGKMYEQVSFVDQGAGGGQNLTIYEQEETAYQFHSDTYCNPDWTGCPWFTYDYQCGASDCTFYGAGTRLNFNCLLTTASGVCPYTRGGECGRGKPLPSNLNWSTIDAFASMGIEKGNSLEFNVNRGNFNATLQNAQGGIASFPTAGNLVWTLHLGTGRVTLDASNPIYSINARKWASLVEQGFGSGVANLRYGSVSRDFTYQSLSADHIRAALSRLGN